MKLSGNFSWKQIAEKLGKTTSQCSGMWHWEKQKLDPAEAVARIKTESESEAVALVPEHDEEVEAEADLDIPTSSRSGDVDDFDSLNVSDWSDIQTMLATGRSREAIASDYDVPVGHLDEFIADRLKEAQERRAAKESAPGEA